MREIGLTQGRVAWVDDADFEMLSQFEWCASFGSRERKWYAVRRIRKDERAELGRRQKISMHVFLMRPPKGMVVDHRNGNSLDNRRENLEIVTQAVNMDRVANWKRKKREEDICL